MARFDTAVELVLKHEGGYVNNPRDPGGETRFGISRRSYPGVDIKNLSRTEAVAIYQASIWTPNNYGLFENEALARKVFDLAVNCGATRANRWLQQALVEVGAQLAVDGVIGERTLAAANVYDPAQVMAGLLKRAFTHYSRLKTTYPEFYKGWIKRLWSV